MRLTELELIQTQMVARHGIRYPTEGNIQDINGLLKRLKPFEELLPLWMRNYTLPYNRSVAGELAVAGKFELWELGVRSLARSGHEKRVMFLKDNYRIAHTHVKRTRDSAIAFVDSFFENPEDVEYIEYPKNTDFLLRFFDQCARYQREHSFGLKRESIEFSPKDLMTVQSACAFDIALYHHKHQWCSLMSMTFIHSLDYLDDLEQFYWIGAGYKINYEMAAVLLRELVDTMMGRVNGSNTLAGNFFFAHAETTLPLVTLMGYGDRSLLLANATKAEINSRGFRTSILSPFGANIEFRLFKRKSGAEEFYVQILVNEKKAKIPGCERVFCKLSELEQQWDYYLKPYDFQKDSPPPTNNSAEEVRNANIQGDKKPREDEIAQVFMPNAESSAVYEPKATDTPLSIPLGSVVELKLDYICATSAAEVEYLKEFAIAGQVSVRGKLHLCGGIPQRSVASAFINAETKHCDSQTCFHLQTDKGNPVTLRFELSPDVATTPLPQLSLEILSRRSQKKKLSLWIALEYLLKKLTIGMEYQSSLQLLDDQDQFCGSLNITFRGGLENSDQTWTTVMHQPEACILTVRLSGLQAAGTEGKDARCLARLWSSLTGKVRCQTISPLMWKNSRDTECDEAKAVSLQVTDAAMEVIFVGIYRYSTQERNEMIGLGRFSLSLPTGDSNSQNQLLEQFVRLYADSSGKESECGSAVLSLQISRVLQESNDNTSVSLAATALGSIAYPVQNTEMKCQFDIDILEVQALPSNVSEGDSISIQLRIAQSNWKTELPPAKVALSGSDGKTLVRVGENASTTVCWAPKDRSFPVLEVFVYIQRRQQNRMSMASRASLASTSNVKRRQIPQRTNEGVAPALVATGSLNLNSFFSQRNVSVRADLQLDVEKAFVENGPTCENATEKVAVLSRLRASSSLENGSKSPGPLESSNYTTQSVKGDVCIHLLQACGSVFRKADSLSSYYVSISCGSEEILSSCCPIDDANTVSWNQQLALPIANTGPPVIRLTLYHRAVDSISPPQHDNASQQHSDDQIVGYLTLPTFPPVLEEDHLLQLEVPFGMPPSSDSTATMQNNDPHYYKRGMLTLEMQFLPSEQPKLASSISSEVYELVIYRVRGNLQDSSTTQRPSGLAKHVFIDVSIMVDRGGTTEELAVGTTDVISLSPSGLTEVGMTVDLSNPMVAATLSTGINSVLVGRIRDLVGNNYGRVHLPLRKDWKERLVNRKKQVWYPVCVESNNAGVNATKDAVQMSLKTREQSCPIGQFNNRNGYIDRKEFTNVFVDHLEDMMVTSDGQKLMHLLFGVDKNQDSSISPALEQITALFSVMDTNRDNEIEWSEYLRFLQQRQQELFATTEEIDENPAIDIPEVKYEQKQELRRKNCEDGRTAASNSADHSAIEFWKRRSARKWFEREWQRQEKYLAHLEAAICIQAAWKGRQQHVLNIRSQEGTPWLDDDSTVEALLYNLVAMVEADVVIPATSEHSFTATVTGDQNVSPLAESLEVEEPSCTEYPFASSKPDDVPVVGDGTVSETNVIVAVLNDLVNAVTRATDVGGDVGGESNGLHASNSDREDEIGNPSCPETEQNIIITESGGLEIDMVSGEDITDNSSNQAANGSDVQEGGLDAPDCSDFRIIHNLIENMKELVALSAVTEGATTHTQPESQVPDSTLDDIDEKAAEFDTTSLSIASEPTVSDVKAILRQQNADEGMPMQDVVSSETSRDDTSTTIDQAQQPLAEAFNTDAAVGDFAIPDDSDDESSIRHSSDGKDSGGSSVDSTDLMMEADAMTTMQDIPESAGSKSARHTRKTTRMDSSVLLADLDQLNAREDPTAPLGN
ncbi:hypothetical protein PC121_g1259 [Phytophthora cactorum]|nr:hypothetical protein PC121_g1259 [Phytophthora cactorum]